MVQVVEKRDVQGEVGRNSGLGESRVGGVACWQSVNVGGAVNVRGRRGRVTEGPTEGGADFHRRHGLAAL